VKKGARSLTTHKGGILAVGCSVVIKLLQVEYSCFDCYDESFQSWEGLKAKSHWLA
jgi:hypothetical protein